MNLPSRLATTYAAMIFIALLVFAAIAVFAIDRTLRSTMDARLKTEAYAASSLSDVKRGRVAVDEDDRQQFSALLAAGDDGMVFDSSGRIALSSAAKPPKDILALAGAASGYRTVGKGDAERRVLVVPIKRNGLDAGTVVVWRASDWIDETDRGAAIAFAGAALLIALLAVVAGGVVTRGALENAFARQRRFTADASHELRAPLAVIRAEADLALRKEREAAQYRAALETIASEADRLESLIGDLLSAARAESGAVVRERVDLAQVAERAAARLMPAATAKGADIAVRAGAGSVILADAHAIERALMAIGHNAVKYAQERGHVEITVKRNGHHVNVAVTDDGPGFSEAAIAHGLERFWRDDSARPDGGSGLGLAIAKSIVEGAGGSIALGNAPRGAQVVLQFPAT